MIIARTVSNLSPIPEIIDTTVNEIKALEEFWVAFDAKLLNWNITQKQASTCMHKFNAARDYSLKLEFRLDHFKRREISTPVLFRQPSVLKLMLSFLHFKMQPSDDMMLIANNRGCKYWACVIACESNHFHAHLFVHNEQDSANLFLPILWEVNDKAPELTRIVDQALSKIGLVKMSLNVS